MSKYYKDWLETDVKELKGFDIKDLSSIVFFRDPFRSLFIAPNLFFSPADGIILYQKEILPDEKTIEIKGRNFTLKNLFMNDKFDKKCLVIGIFLTFLDVHIVRIPTSGYVFYKELPCIRSKNQPMIFLEKKLLEEKTLDYSSANYLFYNSRKINKIVCPKLNYTYYMVEISDSDVDLSLHLKSSGKFHLQGDRLSVIRYGSQVDLVLPVDTRFKFELLQKDGMHVEAGRDVLIKI